MRALPGGRALLAAALVNYPQVQLLKVEDGKGRKLGRSFRVTYWPTLIFLNDGVEVTRLVRPTEIDDIAHALALVAALC
ncbi:thioredoxin family protein [Actimicrobium sp. CCI2.3]|uniref:thioredoxin family protein n=1 Tax=Actimicrobium sp. CCI2.3 TaxID=3048616 RepID=UPI003A100A34